jgi:hypothetical protein
MLLGIFVSRYVFAKSQIIHVSTQLTESAGNEPTEEPESSQHHEDFAKLSPVVQSNVRLYIAS